MKVLLSSFLHQNIAMKIFVTLVAPTLLNGATRNVVESFADPSSKLSTARGFILS